mmetsp:Transcript_43106/g.107697  ORF Transcript_43106/g.107697 Transcript_43106/m.107697 type:complete len:279 (-) Transcript_43106:401-1237(-)
MDDAHRHLQLISQKRHLSTVVEAEVPVEYLHNQRVTKTFVCHVHDDEHGPLPPSHQVQLERHGGVQPLHPRTAHTQRVLGHVAPCADECEDHRPDQHVVQGVGRVAGRVEADGRDYLALAVSDNGVLHVDVGSVWLSDQVDGVGAARDVRREGRHRLVDIHLGHHHRMRPQRTSDGVGIIARVQDDIGRQSLPPLERPHLHLTSRTSPHAAQTAQHRRGGLRQLVGRPHLAAQTGLLCVSDERLRARTVSGVHEGQQTAAGEGGETVLSGTDHSIRVL